MRVRVLLIVLAAILSTDANAGLFGKPPALLEHVPLQWKPTSELRLDGVMRMAQQPIQFEAFQDARSNKEAIGENREDEDKPKDGGHRRCREDPG
jgi:hypothetical protein